MIKNYLIALCDLLDINMPSVSYDTSKFNSKNNDGYGRNKWEGF